MAYTINLTDGTVFATISDGTYNQSSSVTLVGKNYAGYGEFLDENFIQMLENFSNTTAPSAPLTGQLWWDKTNSLLKVYNGTIFKTISAATASASTPTSNVTGDLWYDTTNQQLKVYTGSSFIVVGPAYSSSQGTTGAIPETILDNTSTPHYVTTLYSNSVRVAIFSSDADFTAAAPVSTLFPTVYKGVTFSNASGTNMAGNLVSSGNLIVTTGGTTRAIFTTTGANISGYGNVTGNVTGGNILTAGQVSATGNVTGANFIGNVVSPAGSNVSTTGNITGGNILTAGLISATGTITSAANITGSYFLGNGSQLTGISAAVSVSQIQNGNSNVRIAASDGNVSIGVNSVANVVVIDTTSIYANVANVSSIAKGGTNAVGNIGGPTSYFNVTYTSTLNAVTANASGNITGGNLLFGSGIVSGTGNIAGNYFIGNGSLLTGISTGYGNANVAANLAAFGSNPISTTGNITGGNLVTSGTTGILSVNSITHTGTNAVGNIGSSSSYFNQVFATATTALYADVAERFAADEVLEAGTVVELGGTAEITKSRTELSDNVFGVISTRAAYLMNGGAGENDTHPPVAMTGRVPVKVTGIVRKGDRLVSAGSGYARAARAGEVTAFNVIGRSLVDKLTIESGTIEAIVTIKN